MSLEHSDLFFVNRAASTYKIEAVELGEYLTTKPLPGSTDFIVNDGQFSIKNTNNVDFKGPFVLTSANTSNNTAIDFDEHFIVQKTSDVRVSLNFGEIKNSFLCNTGPDSGFDTDNCDCLAIDFDYVSGRLPCPDGGIVDDNGCLQLNYCPDGLLQLRNPDACLDVKICADAGIHTDGGCIAIDMDFITGNIACKDGGIIEGEGGCLALDYGKVIADMGLGVLTSDDNSIKFKGPGAVGGVGDLTKGNVNIKVNRTVIGGGDGDGTGGGVGDIIAGWGINVNNGGDISVRDVTVSTNRCANGGITIDPSDGYCLRLTDIDEDGCPNYDEAISTERIHVKASGGASRPSLIIGTNEAAKNQCLPGTTGGDCPKLGWTGVFSNAVTGSFTVVRGKEGWVNPDKCGGTPVVSGETDNVFSIAPSSEKISVRPHHASTGLIGSAHSECMTLQAYQWDKDNDALVGGKPVQGEYNRFTFYTGNYRLGAIEPVDRFFDPRVNINIDDALDQIGGYRDDPTVSDGILRWGKKPVDGSDTATFPFLYIDVDELGSRIPGMVNWVPKDDAYNVITVNDSDGNFEYFDFELKPTFNPETDMVAGQINELALHSLALAALVKQKRRIADLEARLDAAGIP